MKKPTALIFAILISLSVFAQNNYGFKYQAIVRDANGNVNANANVNLEISIVQGKTDGDIVFFENHNITSNSLGLVNLTIGSENPENFSLIDWANGPYFIKISIDGIEFGSSQFMSVPYALHANTVKTYQEQDPLFSASPLSSITQSNIDEWNHKSGVGHEADPLFSESTAAGITQSDIENWNHKLDDYTENDPEFKNHAVYAINNAMIRLWDSAYLWGNHKQAGYLKSFEESDPSFKIHPAFDITAEDITKWKANFLWYTTNAYGYLKENSPAGGITASDTAKWNRSSNFEESDPNFNAWNKSTGVSITESQISDLKTYVQTEMDPVYGASIAKGITASDTTRWNNKLGNYTETDPAFSGWNKSTGISITENQISDLKTYVQTESDPIFNASAAKGITSTNINNWNNKLNASDKPGLDAAYDIQSTITADNGALKVAGNDGIISTGNINSGNNLSVSNAGTRMIWYPKKAAFRAGYVSGSNWNDSYIGLYSIAFGYNSKASNSYSSAFGYGTLASGLYSTAMGGSTIASGTYSTALGSLTNAKAYASTAIGQYNVGLGNSTSWVETDPILEVGIGRFSSSRINAMTILKNGNTGIGVDDPDAKLEINGQIKITGGSPTAGKVLTTDANGLASWQETQINDATTSQKGILEIATQTEVDAGSSNLLAVTPSTLNSVVSDLESSMGSTLDQAYDHGGSGVGRIITADNGAVLINGNDGIISTGNYGSGKSLSNSGAGTRMVWFPKKAAFRAGTVTSTQWYETSMGNYSTAFGYNTKAINDAASAFGYETSALGKSSTAMGNSTTASGNFSTSMGRLATASNVAATAMGYSTQASGENSTAMGESTTASGENSTTLGRSTEAKGIQSIAMGYYTDAVGLNSASLGEGSIANGSNSTAMGYYTKANAYGSLAIGRYNTGSGSTTSWSSSDPVFEIGIGSSNTSRANALTVLKDGNVGIGVYDPDTKLEVAGQIKITGGLPAAGKVLTSNAYGLATWEETNISNATTSLKGILEIATQAEVDAGSSATLAVTPSTLKSNLDDKVASTTSKGLIEIATQSEVDAGSSTTLVVTPSTLNSVVSDLESSIGSTLDEAYDHGGSGVGKTITADNGALTIKGNDGIISTGNFGTGKSLAFSSAGTRMVWFPKKAAFRAGRVTSSQWYDSYIGDYSTAFGYDTKASGSYAVAMGSTTNASGVSSIALGQETYASNNYAVAMGYKSSASNTYSMATGRETRASGSQSTAMGYKSSATGVSSTALGNSTTASGEASTASGYNTTASGVYSTAFGASTTASGTYTTAIGNTTIAKAYASTALGQYNVGMGTTTSWVTTDPILEVGIGRYSSSKTNAMTILKNGNTGLGVNDPDAKLEINGQIKITGGTPGANKVLTSDANGLASWQETAEGVTNINDLSDAKTQSTSLFIGTSSGNSTTTSGTGNTAIGQLALVSNSSGDNNTAIGYQALNRNTSSNNVAIGALSLQLNTSGQSNNAIGSGALSRNTTGFDNTAIGTNALYKSSTGSKNIAIGNNAGYSAYSTSGNIFIGHSAGYYETGSNKLYIDNTTTTAPLVYGEFDNDLLKINGKLEVTSTLKIQGGSPGDGKVLTSDANGLATWQAAASASINNLDDGRVSGTSVFLGNSSGTNATGSYNTAVGNESMESYTTGRSNTAMGHRALMSGSGDYNAAFGPLTMPLNTSGHSNSTFGAHALNHNTTGYENSTLGMTSLFGITIGNQNTALGFSAGYSVETGSGNVFIGYKAGYNETGSDKLYIENSNSSAPLIYGDFNTNELTINGNLSTQKATISDVLKLTPRGSAPSSPENGEIYVGTDDHIYCYLGGVWKQLDN